MIKPSAFRALPLILLVCLGLSVPAFGQKFGKLTDEDRLVGQPDDYPEANSVILFDRAEMEVKLDIIVIDYHVRIKILTRAGVTEAGERSFWYNEEYDNVRDFKAHTITADGKKHKVEKSDVFDRTVGDLTERIFSFPALEPGCIIEYKYQLKSKRHWYLRPRYFQNDIYTMHSELALSLEPGFSYDIDYSNVPGQYRDPVVTKRPNPNRSSGISHIKTYTWKMNNLLPISEEPYMGSENDYRTAIRFQLISYTSPGGSVYTFVKDWPDLGNEFETGLNRYCNKLGQVEEIARQVTAGATTSREQSEALFTYVATEYQTSTERLTKWLEHDKLSQLLEEKKGHGEEKNLLLVQLHRQLGLDAWPVLISRRENGKFNPKFPSVGQFDYMICFVQFGDEWEFLDANGEHMPYGLLPPNCLTDGGLLIDGAQSSLVRITIKPIRSSREDVTIVRVAADGSTACSTNCNFAGYYAAEYGDLFSRTDPKEFVQEVFLDRIDGSCHLAGHHCRLDSGNCFVAELAYSGDELCRKLDNNVLIKPVQYSFTDNPFKHEKRFFPVDFAYPFIYLNRVEIFSETPAEKFSMPENLEFEIDGAKFERVSMVTDSCVIVTSRLTVSEPLFRPSRYQALRNFFDKVALAGDDEATIVLSDL